MMGLGPLSNLSRSRPVVCLLRHLPHELLSGLKQQLLKVHPKARLSPGRRGVGGGNAHLSPSECSEVHETLQM